LERQLGGSAGLPHTPGAAIREECTGRTGRPSLQKEASMSKRGRKRRSRKKSNANHGKRPNA
jgi:hypothetical protein